MGGVFLVCVLFSGVEALEAAVDCLEEELA